MKRFFTLLLLLVLAGGGFALYHRDQLRRPADWMSWLEQVSSWDSKTSRPAGDFDVTEWGWVADLDRITISSFKVTGASQNEPGWTADAVAEICRQFDLTALQLPGTNRQLMREIEARLNAEQPVYRIKLDNRNCGYAFIYDARSVELVGDHTYTVNDPEHLFQRPPFVGWFRARGVSPEEAFTFTVVNYQAAEFPMKELRHLDELFRAVRDDGRGEDDILLVGDFQAAADRLAGLEAEAGLVRTISHTRGNAWNPQPYDNFLQHSKSTVERGGFGVIDLVSQYNWRVSQAERLSSRQPIWAEYSRREGVTPASRDTPHVPIRHLRQSMQVP